MAKVSPVAGGTTNRARYQRGVKCPGFELHATHSSIAEVSEGLVQAVCTCLLTAFSTRLWHGSFLRLVLGTGARAGVTPTGAFVNSTAGAQYVAANGMW